MQSIFKIKNIVKSLIAAGAALPFLIIFGCEDSTGPRTDIVFPDVNVSYSQHVQPLFNQTCALSGCHDDATAQRGLSLTSYTNLTAHPGTVVPGDPDASILYLRITGHISPQMPLNRPPLNQNQQQGIRTWIEEGAENN